MEDKWLLIKHTGGEDLIHINKLSRITKGSSTTIIFCSSDVSSGLTLVFSDNDETNKVLKSIDDRFTLS